MLFIFGIKIGRMVRYTDNKHICYPCKSYDREVNVYRPYFHFCMIPVFPTGPKQWEMRCRNCGDETLLESVIKEYEGKARTPLYYYAALILAAGLTLFWFYWNKHERENKIEFVRNPVAGDVYTITKQEDNNVYYQFLKLVRIEGDSVGVLHNTLDYGTFVSNLTDKDYFVKDDTTVITKKELNKMLETDEIYSVDRNYNKWSGFDRIQ